MKGKEYTYTVKAVNSYGEAESDAVSTRLSLAPDLSDISVPLDLTAGNSLLTAMGLLSIFNGWILLGIGILLMLIFYLIILWTLNKTKKATPKAGVRK
ncbi:hypothetical protein PDUR_28045 (plasmid) [Paenibacillus durus]|uniref:Fibronectin type-III domain-containing protein n=1 Tax=Paenibacillus durus TaxID=44251 RepID=A0A089HTB1_PAEDU|nr:hypothetical protein PDUR_28045 [Paenibacillus durus]